jgi:hypothetical protein
MDALCVLEPNRLATVRVRNEGTSDAEVTVRLVPGAPLPSGSATR